MKKSAKTTDLKSTADHPASAGEMDSKSHTALFSEAMKCFTAGDYRKAKALFDQASKGPRLQVNESALMYSRMCGQRLERSNPELRSPEDHYNFAISLINSQKYQDAKPHLEAAISGRTMPHYYYALALVEGLLGAIPAAAQQLRRAIESDPSIRSVARNDVDFAPLLQHPQIREILAGEHAHGA